MKSCLPEKTKTGNGSGIITDDNAIIDPGEIEENFNFLISIGANLQKKSLSY